MAISLARQGKQERAEQAFRQAIQIQPEHAKAHNNFGVLLADMGKRKEAFEAWQNAVRFDPNYPEAQFNFAMALAEAGEADGAVEHYENALRLKPDYAEALNNLGLLHHERGRPHDAVVLLEQAVRLRPDYVEAWNNLALSRVDVGRGEEAIAAYREALRLHSNEAEIHNNLGTALAALNRPEEALACYRHALRLKPEYPEVRWHQALTWLTLGDFERGWPEYEWRWRRRRSRPRNLEGPLWDGSPLPGKSLLLWCEQGLGDSIQFARYVALAKERVGNLILEGPSVLRPLLSSCKGVDQWINVGEPLPAFAAHAPLMTLPKIFETTLVTIPNQTPYLSAEADKIAEWKVELNATMPAGNLRVGIAWQGNPNHRWDRHRSFPIDWFDELARTPGVSLVSLQKGHGAEQLSEFRRQHAVLDLGTRSDPDGVFRDTPAIVSNLDLVICCDTSLAHLAGAMNVPVWIPLAKMADWRWLRLRSDSPWYPSLRLFRQKQHGEWSDVFEKIVRELRTWMANGRGRRS
ncbi:MAG: tetratricopeptide repeat-containing glycosyltransferase family protein [Gemmataceae bacterium]|nr:tetratricopeptide repeat-containing glycosyltransferase family protein [Gemmataceae bacterium]